MVYVGTLDWVTTLVMHDTSHGRHVVVDETWYARHFLRLVSVCHGNVIDPTDYPHAAKRRARNIGFPL